MPGALGKKDYNDFADRNNLTFNGPLPITTKTPTNWTCNKCGRELNVSLAAFRVKENRTKNHGAGYYACQCAHPDVISNEEARARFAKHGLELNYDLIPRGVNQKLPVTFKETGERLECTLYWLYPTCSRFVIPKRIREIIGRENDDQEFTEQPTR